MNETRNARTHPIERVLAFNLSGQVIHSIFWQNLSPNSRGHRRVLFAEAIQKDFDNFDIDFESTDLHACLDGLISYILDHHFTHLIV